MMMTLLYWKELNKIHFWVYPFSIDKSYLGLRIILITKLTNDYNKYKTALFWQKLNKLLNICTTHAR